MVRLRCSTYSSDHTGVSPIIGTVLMVAVTIILAAATFMLILPMMNQDVDVEDEQFFVDQNSVTQNGPDDWDTSFTILKIKKDEAIPWNTVSFACLDASGAMITDAAIQYGDTNQDGYVQEGDTIILSGMTDAYDGATLKILYKGQLLGVFTISFNST